MAAVMSCENTLLPVEQESWVLSELDKGRIKARDKHARKDVLARPSSFARLNFSLSLAL